MEAAVKYCGGCNPHFERTAAAARLERALRKSLVPAQPGRHYAALYVVCGCMARCADISSLEAEQIIYLDPADHLSPTQRGGNEI